MGFEDDYNPSGTITKVTRNVLGARGIDRISITENSATTHGYHLYDGHGNCRAILTKDGTDGYATGNWRTYDVWGSVRSGSATSDPKSRYVASIGHVADDESSLIYMRARYYEPATGRFISEDPARDGANWYIYCDNNPITRYDVTGKEGKTVSGCLAAFLGGLIFSVLGLAGSDLLTSVMLGGLFGVVDYMLGITKGIETRLVAALNPLMSNALKRIRLALTSRATKAAERSLASPALLGIAKNAGELQGALLKMELEIWENEGGSFIRELFW